MTESVQAALIVAIPPTLAAVIAWIGLLRQGKQQITRLDQIHVVMNSRLTEALMKIDQLEAKLASFENKI